MAAPNILNVTSMYGKTAVADVTTSLTNLVTNAGGSGTLVKIGTLIIGNFEGTNNADVNVAVLRSGVYYYIAGTITVPADTSLVAISRDAAIYLEEGDSLAISATVNSRLKAICSYEVIA